MDVVIQQAGLDSSLVAGMRTIYFDSFPPSERQDFDLLMADIGHGKRLLYAAKIGDDLVGFAVVVPLPNTDTAMLEYLAIDRSLRSLRIGSALMEGVVRAAQSAGEWQGFVLEVEPLDSPLDQGTEDRRRRMAFYGRHGALPIECAPGYRMPDLQSGHGSVPMSLLWLPLSENAQPPSGRQLEACIRSIYRHGYSRNHPDPMLETVLRDLRC